MNKLFNLISFAFLFALAASQGFSGDADRAIIVNYDDFGLDDDAGDLGCAQLLDADGNVIEVCEEIGENEEYGEVTEGILITDFTNFNVVDYESEAEDGEIGLEEEFSGENEEFNYAGSDIVDEVDDADPESDAVDIDQSGDAVNTLNIDNNEEEIGESVVNVDIVDESDDINPDSVDIDQSGDAIQTVDIDGNGDIVDESDGSGSDDAGDIDQSGDAETINIDGDGGETGENVVNVDIVDESDDVNPDGVDIDQGGEAIETINIDENGDEIGESIVTDDIVDDSDDINSDGVDIDQDGESIETINIDGNGGEIGEGVVTIDDPNPPILINPPEKTDEGDGVTFDAENGDIRDDGDEIGGDSADLNDDVNDGAMIDVAPVQERGFLP